MTDPNTAPDKAFRLSSIAQIAVRVKDIPGAVEFYRDKLGLPFLFEAPGLAFFRAGDLMLMLSHPSAPEFDHPASILYFEVDDIDEAFRVLSGRGVPFQDRPHLVHKAPDYELWMSFFHDPEKSTMAIREVRKPRP